MRIDVWSDILCPFCHLGRRHLELALEQFEHGDEVGVVWHSFQLDRTAPAVDDTPAVDRVAEKYGVPREQMVAQHERMAADAAAAGLDFQWQTLRGGNSYDAHRLIHLARALGREDEVTERVMRAWYSEGESIGDPETLVRLGVEAGLDEAAVRDLLAGDDHGIDVRTDLALASQIGITSVPTFVLDQKFGVSGAQPVEVMLNAIRQVWDLQGTEPEPVAEAGGCGGGCCGGACGSGGDGRRRGRDAVDAGHACGSGGCGGACEPRRRERQRLALTGPAPRPGTRTPRVPGRAHLPLLHSCPGGVQRGTTTRGAGHDPRRAAASRKSSQLARRRAAGPSLAQRPRLPGGRHLRLRPRRAITHGKRRPGAISSDAHPLVASPAEDSHSGLVRTIGNRVGIKPSGVQIPHPPPHNGPGACARDRRVGGRPAAGQSETTSGAPGSIGYPKTQRAYSRPRRYWHHASPGGGSSMTGQSPSRHRRPRSVLGGPGRSLPGHSVTRAGPERHCQARGSRSPTRHRASCRATSRCSSGPGSGPRRADQPAHREAPRAAPSYSATHSS